MTQVQQQTVLSWLKDAHALEVGAIPTLTGHAEAAEHYPEVRAKLEAHAEATRRHAELIEGCITRLGGRPSALKEAVGGVLSSVAAVANLPAKDTVIKNALGDFAAENFEIISYRSLIAAAERLGDLQTADVCRQILRDEEEMSGWLGGHIATLTQAFLDGQSEEGQGSGLLSSAQEKVTDMAQKGKDAASSVDTKTALLASGAILAGAGAALLISQTLRGGSDRSRQEGEGESYRVPDEETGAASMEVPSSEEPEALVTEADATAALGLDDAAALMAADAPLLEPEPTEPVISYVETEIWLVPGPFSGIAPRSYTTGDAVGQEVALRLTQHGGVDAADIEITSEGGEVLLEGTVDSDETKRLAEEAARSVAGVETVQNLLQVKSGAGQAGETKEFEHSTTINASPDEVFEFMSKVENLPKYLPTTKAAQPQEGERVRVQGEAQGHQYDSDGFFRADRTNHRIEWGADERYYSGYLEVQGQGDGSVMTVHLSFSGGPPAGQGDAPGEGDAPSGEQIQEGLVTALESIKNFVEEGRSGGKEEPSAAT